MKTTLVIFRTLISGYIKLIKPLMIVCLLLITVVCKAQDRLIGKSYYDVNVEMISLHNANTSIGETAIANQWQATYKVGEGFAYCFLFSKSDSECTGFRELMRKDLMASAVNNLNRDYTKVDDSHWVSKDNAYKLTLEILPDGVSITHIKVK